MDVIIPETAETVAMDGQGNYIDYDDVSGNYYVSIWERVIGITKDKDKALKEYRKRAKN